MKSNLIKEIITGCILITGGYTQINWEMETKSYQNLDTYVTFTESAPVIDGILDDAVWQDAAPFFKFLQVEPDNMAQPSEQTEIRLLYDLTNVYIYARMYDSNPEKVFGRYARRDDWFEGFENSSDWFTIDIDSRHDHQTAYSFGVNSVGVQWDAMLLEDSFYDDDWDAIWYAATHVDSLGWTIEFEIPFSVFRYIPKNSVWGLSMERFIQRKNETVKWPAYPRGTKGKSSIFGHLQGFEYLPVIKHTELIPFVLLGTNRFQNDMLLYPDSLGDIFDYKKEKSFPQEIGIDLKYHLTSSSVFDFTVFPDFGQIEADPSVINLTAYETRFDEKRPFFMENSGIFDTPIEVFYSRRIGEEIDSIKIDGKFKPIGSKIDSIYLNGDLLKDSITIHQDTKLISAGKLTGKTAKGYSFGLIYGLSENKFSLKNIENNYNHYVVSRLTKDVLRGNSYFGIMSSHLNNTFEYSHNISADGTLLLNNNQVELSGQVVQSNNNGNTGLGMYGFASYHHPKYFSIMIESDFYDKDFNLHNVGFLSRNNLKKNLMKLIFRMQSPWKIIRYTSFGIEYNQEKNIDDLLLQDEYQFEYTVEFENYWRIISHYYQSGEHFDDLLTYDYETGKIGPIAKLPSSDGYSVNFFTDDSKQLSWNVNIGYGTNDFDDKKFTYNLDIFYEPNNYIMTQVGFLHRDTREKNHWLEIIEVESGSDGGNMRGSTTSEDSLRFIFSEAQDQLNILTFWISVNYSKNLSIQFYSEYYRNKNLFSKYSELFEDKNYPITIDSLDQNPYTETGKFPFEDDKFLNPNFYTGLFPKYGEFNTNLVLKWEFAPGSNLYLVYSINKAVNGRLFNNFRNFLEYDTPCNWEEIYFDQSLFLKVDYWFNL